MTASGRLAGKVALITGSTSGIGAGMAKIFAREGASVMISGRNVDAGRKVIEEIASEGVPHQALAFQSADLTDVEQCRALVPSVQRAFSGLDILVNNAAEYTRGTIEDTTVELWDYHMALNVRAPFVLTQSAIPAMRARGGGSIINIGSVNAYIGGANLTSYSVSKGALMTLTKNVAQQVSSYKTRVNQIKMR